MKTELTKQEQIIVALMRGNHLEPKEVEIAKQQVHAMSINIQNNETTIR